MRLKAGRQEAGRGPGSRSRQSIGSLRVENARCLESPLLDQRRGQHQRRRRRLRLPSISSLQYAAGYGTFPQPREPLQKGPHPIPPQKIEF